MPTAVVSLGRLPKALDICRALDGAGWRVVVAEPSRRHLAGTSRAVARSVQVPAPNEDADAYLDAMMGVLREEDASLLVPVSEEVVHLSRIADRLPPRVRWFGVGHDATLRMHDKAAFVADAAKLGLAVPQTHGLGSREAQLMADSGAVVVKPAFTCSGQGLVRVPAGGRLPDPGAAPRLVQRALPGRHTSSFSIVHEGRVIGTVVYTPVVTSGTVAAAFERIEGAAEAGFAQRHVEAHGLSGFVSFDFIADEAGVPRAIECNPRATSGIHFVEPASLARAILEPEACRRLTLRRARRMHQFWPVLTEVQHAMFRPGRGYFAKMGTLLRSTEVNWSWRDPLPVLAQPWAAWGILGVAAREGISFGEAATRDIAWFGEPSGVGAQEVGAAFADHDGGRIGVPADDARHDRGVGDAQPVHPAHP